MTLVVTKHEHNGISHTITWLTTKQWLAKLAKNTNQPKAVMKSRFPLSASFAGHPLVMNQATAEDIIVVVHCGETMECLDIGK